MSKTVIYLLLLTLSLASCDIKNSDIEPEAAFVKVYESTNIDEVYYPQDILQLSDGNYLILAALIDSIHSRQMNFPAVCLIAVDKAGDVLDREILPENYSKSVPGWIEMNGKEYFVCMDDITNQAKLLEVEIIDNSISYSEAGDLDNDFPLYTWSDGENVLLLSFDSWGATVVTKYNQNFSSQWQISFDIDEDLREKTMAHMRLDNPKPFFIEAIRNQDGSKDFMVNCFERSSLVLKFLSGSNGSYNFAGIYSYQEETGLTAALHHSGNIFSIARFHSGNSYAFPNAIIDRESLIHTKDLDDILITQLRPDAPTDIMLYEHHDENYIVYASTTWSNQILLLFFNKETGLQEYSHSLGFGNPVEVTKILKADDGGLIILGETRINEKYQRIILYKIDKDQLLFEEE